MRLMIIDEMILRKKSDRSVIGKSFSVSYLTIPEECLKLISEVLKELKNEEVKK